MGAPLYGGGENVLRAMLKGVKISPGQLTLNRLSPYYLFGEATATLLNPSVRSVNAVTVAQLSGALSSTLSVGQSMLLVWPHLTALAALMLIAFAISYVSFMRQEIRSR